MSVIIRLCRTLSGSNGLRRANKKRSYSCVTRGLDVAVIGAPNVGKSLLTNQLVRAAVSSVSSKMDTTTKNVNAILTEDNIQLILVDSPGTVSQRHVKTMSQNGNKVLTEPENAIQKAEHILVVQDATATGDYIHHRVMHLLHRYSHVSSSLVINKIDMVPRRNDLLELTRILTNGRVAGTPIKIIKKSVMSYTSISCISRRAIDKPSYLVGFGETKLLFSNIRGWSNFSAVFFVSALTGEGIEPLRQHLKKLSIEKVWKQNEMAVTNVVKPKISSHSITLS
ncbi:hypothetical protein DICVIV_11782 [Dictyocaulus viviparus]|uniref:GTPase Era, mitochondrial n=1 Tax=Dictyocaulus viviparus TaxID=29172 RepID=A0A0D8XC97_DICVI|nr:hypothetical protein DICVIV_11782 [Dictyocaulus viviparus]